MRDQEESDACQSTQTHSLSTVMVSVSTMWCIVPVCACRCALAFIAAARLAVLSPTGLHNSCVDTSLRPPSGSFTSMCMRTFAPLPLPLQPSS